MRTPLHIAVFAAAVIVLLPTEAFAQQPKMHIKIFLGVNTTTFVKQIDDRPTETFAGFQGGLGARVKRRNLFMAFDLSFMRFGFELTAAEAAELGLETTTDADGQMNSVEIPLVAGYIPYQRPIFKWYVYGGLVNRFYIKAVVDGSAGKERLSPKDVDLPVYQAMARFGSAIDVAFFHFDASYSLGINNASRSVVRTNLHVFQFNVGYLF